MQATVEDVRGAAHIAPRVLPVSDGNAQIGAKPEAGRVVVGEWQIIQRQPRSAVVHLFLQPPIAAPPAVLEAIAAADVLGYPGSWLTGMLSVLLPVGLREAIAASQATGLYVCSLMTRPGQTDALTAGHHLALQQQYLGRHVDAVLLNNGPLPPELLQLYASHGAFPVVDDLTASAVPIYRADLVEHPNPETLATYARSPGTKMQVGLRLMRHDAGKLAA
ncbi:Gluconeogenesis factor [Candidatus Entotheonellaceae bacterium PAL068K]